MVDVIPTVLERILDSDPGGLIGVYLYGSSTTTGLGPESDIDLLLVTRVSLTLEERRRLVATLLELSGWKGHAGTFPEVVDRRPLEVTSVVAEDLDPLTTAPKRDFQFGEWLRTDVVAGRMPHAEHDPDLVVLLATALASHRVLHGPPLDSLVDDVPFDLLQQAQLAGLPGLVDDLHSDSRNVLLTLARALHTIETGEIVAKDHAADRAAARVEGADAELLRAAAREHRGDGHVDWDRMSTGVSALARSLVELIHRTAGAP